MKILLINHYAGSPLHGMEFRPYYLAREWVTSGHSVKIVAGSFSHIRAKQPIKRNMSGTEEVINGVMYLWLATSYYKGNGLGRLLNILSFLAQLWSLARELALNFKPDIVIASSTYPMDIWPAKKIADLAGAKLVYEVHDLWPLSPKELGGLPNWHPFVVWVQYAEDYAYKHSEKVVSILPKTLDYMLSRGLAPEKWVHVPNGVALSEWQSATDLPDDIQNIITDLKNRGSTIVGYVGTHGLSNALDTLLDAAVLLKGRAQVLLVGTGPERDRLKKRVFNERIDNVTMLRSVPKTCIPRLMEQIDIAYIGWHQSSLYRFGISPNKLMDYMMAGRPIIHAVCAANDPVKEANCGLSVRPKDPAAVARAVRVLCDLSSEERLAMGAKGRQFVMSHRLYATLAVDFLVAVSAENRVRTEGST